MRFIPILLLLTTGCSGLITRNEQRTRAAFHACMVETVKHYSDLCAEASFPTDYKTAHMKGNDCAVMTIAYCLDGSGLINKNQMNELELFTK